jgi:hypothetical protein
MAKTSGSGMFGSGIFGFLGTTIVCNASDTSLYCTVMKGINIIIVQNSVKKIFNFINFVIIYCDRLTKPLMRFAIIKIYFFSTYVYRLININDILFFKFVKF